jgi:hypothetical protein
LVTQGVRGALRSKNMRLLLDAAKAPEDLALLAEMPLERLQNMAAGALCSDETTYHLEQQLELPSGWLDRMNSTVPENYLTSLANPQRHLQDEDAPSSSSAPAPVGTDVSATASSAAPETVPQGSGPAPALLSGQAPDEPAPAGSKPASTATQAPASGAPAVQEPAAASSAVSPSQPANETDMTTPTELRRANLNVLLSGKGAKSALARLLSLSPASVTGMLNGVKPLDKELLQSMTQGLHLAENWFDKERSAADIPPGALKLLSPLVRGASAPAAAPRPRPGGKQVDSEPSGATRAQGASAATDTPGPAATARAAPSAPPVDKPTTWPAGNKVARLRDLTNAAEGAQLPGASPQAPANPPASNSALSPAAQPLVPDTSPLQGGASRQTETAASLPLPGPSAAKPVPEQQRGDSYAGMTAVLHETLLPPIAEALIRTLAQKATSGALSEDKAFELLGSVRTL